MTPALPALRVRDVAQRLAVKPDQVLVWIRRGELRALDVSQARGLKPRWRILPGDLASFEASRMATPPAPPVRRRRRDPLVKEYF